MRGWWIRGLNMAVLWAIVQTVHARLAAFGAMSPTWTVVLLALLAAVALAWGAVDTWQQREDRGTTWLKACLVAGVGGALLGVAGQAAFVDRTGAWALGPALLGAAPFIALLVLLPAAIGFGVGAATAPRRRGPARADTGRRAPRPSPRNRSEGPAPEERSADVTPPSAGG